MILYVKATPNARKSEVVGWEEDPIVRNTMAGGDNAARGLFIGLMMGITHGTAWMPSSWTEGLRTQVEFEALLTLITPCSKFTLQPMRIPHPEGHQFDGFIEFPDGS